MDTQKLIPYLSIISFILILSDIIVIYNWSIFVRKWKKNKSYIYIAWILFVLMIIISFIGFYLRFQNYHPDESLKYLYISAGVWYIPKIVIATFFILKFLIKTSINFIKIKFFKSKHKTEQVDLELLSKRRKFIETTGWTVAGIPFIMVGNGMIRTSTNLELRFLEIEIKNLPTLLDGFKIAHISDIHAGSFYNANLIKKTVQLINANTPDLVCITGDFVNFNHKELEFIEKYLRSIESVNGTFACLGNHDHYMDEDEHQILIKYIKNLNINLLINENKVLDINGNKLQIAGCDNTGKRTNFANFEKTIEGLNNWDPKILLCHDPSNWDKSIRRKLGVDLTLSGHTHGGQISFNIFGDEFTPSRFTYKQYDGLYRDGDEYLYINRGLGTTGPPVRIGVRPELTILKLRAPSNLA